MTERKILFVGERRTKSAREIRWTWDSGQLSAKTLLDALAACGLSLIEHQFTFENAYEDDGGENHSACENIELTFRILFPGSMMVFRGVPIKRAWTDHREPLQSVSLGSFLTSSRHHTGVVPGEAASGLRAYAAGVQPAHPATASFPRFGPSASVSQGTFGACYGPHHRVIHSGEL